MAWFKRKPPQARYAKAVVQVAFNLYLYTLPGSKDAPAQLVFKLPDSRFRYLLFCISTVVMAVWFYDEDNEVEWRPLLGGCLKAITWLVTERREEFFEPGFAPEDVNGPNVQAYLRDILNHWEAWPDLRKAGDSVGIWELISRLIHTAESLEEADKADLDRLSPLALEIDCRMATMRGAALELAHR